MLQNFNMMEKRFIRCLVVCLGLISIFLLPAQLHGQAESTGGTTVAGESSPIGLESAGAFATALKTPKSLSEDDKMARDIDRGIDGLVNDEVSEADGFINRVVTKEAGEYLPKGVIEVMNKEVFGNSAWQLSCSLLLLIATLLLRNIIIRGVLVYVRRLLLRTRFQFDKQLLEAIHKPLAAFLLLLGVFIALMVLSMSDGMRHFIENLYRGLVVLTLVWALLRMVDVFMDVMVARTQSRDQSMLGFVPPIRKTIKIFIGLVGFIMVIDNLGFNVGGILATLGIGGAALAFASKDTIANGFGTLMIMLDRPFKVGDWIIVGDKVDGDVEEIGLRSTKVRTWPKTVLSIPNGVLANEYINNWSRMPKRRVKQVINIAHGATANDMQGLVLDIRTILKTDEGVEQEFILVSFTDITADSLEILVYYFTISIKWLEYMEVRERVNLKMMRAVEERGLKIAFLEQSLELEYNKDGSDEAKLPWNERWAAEPQSNPQGLYTRRMDKTRNSSTVNKQGSPELPGDFGPTQPL